MKLSLIWSVTVKVGLYASVYVWPAYASFHAIETKHSLDDTQWLFYWLIFAVFTMLEGAIWPVLKYIPLYQELKLLFFAFLSLPQTSGAKLLYMKARPYILQGMSVVDTKYAEMKGGEVRSDKKEAELAKLRAQIADVQDELHSSLSTDYECVKANTMDGALLGKKIEKLQSEISAVAPPNSPVMSGSSASLPPVDAKVTATIVSSQDPASALAMSS